MFFTFKNCFILLKNTKVLFLIVYYSHLIFFLFPFDFFECFVYKQLCSSVDNSTPEVAGICGCHMLCLLTHPLLSFHACFVVLGCELTSSRITFGNSAGLDEECIPSGKIWSGSSHRAGGP